MNRTEFFQGFDFFDPLTDEIALNHCCSRPREIGGFVDMATVLEEAASNDGVKVTRPQALREFVRQLRALGQGVIATTIPTQRFAIEALRGAGFTPSATWPSNSGSYRVTLWGR